MKKLFSVMALALLFASCKKEISTPPVVEELSTGSFKNSNSENLKNDELELNLTGLENLGPNARYEGWVIIDGSPLTTGVFTVNNSGQMSQTVHWDPDFQVR
jgi:hypothetical protein